MLTDVMLYWLTATAGSSARTYHANAASWGREATSTVPTAVAVFPRDIALPVRTIAEQTNNIARWTTFDRGGHFGPLEEPDLLLGDLRAFFRDHR
jgi:microsomal epoxide hydrolase